MEIPQTIYHYCSTDAFYSIIQSECIFGTINTQLNDPTENYYVIDKLKLFIDQNAHRINKELLNQALKQYAIGLFQTHCFITSFTGNNDLISQWRAYANNGTGVAIGFNIQSFCNTYNDFDTIYSNSKMRHKYLQPVEYDFGQLDSFFAENCPNIQTIEDVNRFTNSLSRYDYRLKHSAYHEENEYRIIEYFPMDGMHKDDSEKVINFKSNSSNITPYVTHNIFEIERSIESLIIGPKSDLDEDIAKLFLDFHNVYIDKDKIIKSKVPYR